MSLKALADAVLARNRSCNKCATDPEKPRNKRPPETPVLLHDLLHAESINSGKPSTAIPATEEGRKVGTVANESRQAAKPGFPVIADAINADAIEFFEERAAIAEYDGGLTREEAEKEAREATERHRRECWERHQRNAERILSLPTWAAREQALERYRKAAMAQYGDKAGATMAKEMRSEERRVGKEC